MKRQTFLNLCLLVAGGLFLLCTCKSNSSTATANAGMYSSTYLPQDPLPVCTLDTGTFDTWFQGGVAVENGAVTPANSVDFIHNVNCDFYKWAERMFLWITSPSTGQYGTVGRVLESPIFYTVVGDDKDSLSHLVRHQPDSIFTAVSALRKNGPNRLPVFTDDHGHLFEVQFHKPGEKVLVRNQAGQVVELTSVEKTAAGQVLLKDRTGKTITPVQFVNHFTHPERVLHAFKTAAGVIFLDDHFRPKNTYLDQATGDALMAQDGSLVYYITFVNDVYAYYLTAVKDHHAISGVTFPTDSLTRDSIVAYAASHGFPSPSDSNALAIEIKSSWVVANDSLVKLHPENYITTKAIVPIYYQFSPRLWVPNGTQRVTLMLVGIHIVGSVSGHPEMIWSTFENENNAPDTTYQYLDSTNHVQTLQAELGKWRFSSAAGAPFNLSHIRAHDSLNSTTLVADSSFTISPSNTQRSAPFGVAFAGQPNNEDTSASHSNSQIIGMNNSIINHIPGNDPRKKFIFIGATWTFGGAPPNGNVYPADTTHGSAIGTSILANSTMETYFQAPGNSCFSCHNSDTSLLPGALSHIFSTIRPLMPKRK